MILVLVLAFFFIFVFLSFLGLVFSFSEKRRIGLSSYECGFSPFGYPIVRFSIPFYVLLIIFVVFDLEVVLFLGFVFSNLGGLLLFFFFTFFAIFTFYLEFYLSSFKWKELALFGYIIYSGRWVVRFISFKLIFFIGFFSLLFSRVVLYLFFLVYFYSYFYLFLELRLFYFLVVLFSFSLVMCFLLFSDSSWAFLIFWDLLGISRFFLIFYYMRQASVYGRVVTLLTGRFGDFFLFLVLFVSLRTSISSSFFTCLVAVFILFVGITKSAQFPFMG